MVRDKPVFEVCFWSHLNNTILGRSCPLFLEKEKLRHSLGQPSRSDFVQSEFGDEILMDFQLDYQNHKPLLITLAGLPGTGKTTLAKAFAKNLSLVYLRLDCIEVPFYRYNATSGLKGEGYDAIVNLARENLNLGLDVIVDTVNPLHLIRKLFRDLAKESNANLLQFELKTNNLLLHKKRVEQRKADIVGHNLPTWNKVLNVKYEEWDKSVDGLVTVIFTDNGEKAFSECLDTIQNHLD